MRSKLCLLVIFMLPIPAMAGTIGSDDRLSIEDYAKFHGRDIPSVRDQFQASGRIMCPFGEASAFLVYRDDVVMTARHVLFPEKQMNSYAGKGSINRCGFELTDGEHSTWYKVDVKSFVYPDDKKRSVNDRFDWVIMRLESPASGVKPYALSDQPAKPGDAAELVTIRQNGFPNDGWNERIVADCHVRSVDTIDELPSSGIRTDCSATGGASGGAFLRQGATGLEVVGVMSSSTGSCARFDAGSCFSYMVGIGQAARNAIMQISYHP